MLDAWSWRERLEEQEGQLGPRQMYVRTLREIYLRKLRTKFKGEDGLMAFIEHFWHVLEPGRPFQKGWALKSMCKHLMAVTSGDITRLLINVPPGSMKSLLVNVFWPAWEWGPGGRPDLRYISFSYSSHLTWRDNQKFRDLVAHPDFVALYPKWHDPRSNAPADLKLREDSKIKVSNSATGWKFATSVRGVGTGERADRVILDDPHNIKESESDTIRSETVRWFMEAMSNRLNDMTTSVIIVIMQRVHEDDVSGAIIANKLGYTHLCIPLEYEADRRCITYVRDRQTGQLRAFWADPRRIDGECFWPQRFDPAAVVMCKLLGEHAFAGQYQQRPEPRGGGLFKRAYWMRLPMPDRKYPKLHYIIASLDGAFTEKKENDPSGFTCWGAFVNDAGDHCAVTLSAWRKHLPLHGTARAKEPAERWATYKAETEKDWGLIQWLHYECNRWGIANKLLIENKANGHHVAQEMIRLFKYGKFIVELVDPKQNDKFARGIRVQPVFAEGLIYTLPEEFGKRWVSDLVTELAMFPRGRYDDMVDSTTQALWWLRQHGWLIMADERKQELVKAETRKRNEQPLYEA